MICYYYVDFPFHINEDYSNRFHETLEGYAASTNRYSVDECFMSLAGMTHLIDPERYGREIRATLQHNLSLTCGVGVGISKTLALYSDQVFCDFF
ncbi:hypothetical protein [Enterobacter mori]|uniref:Y-family DNA polymerase n=1 Tax=Enterobacter mori TaxID=539813 RepID=UPI003B83F41A